MEPQKSGSDVSVDPFCEEQPAGKGESMVIYRRFRNVDPPGILELWNSAFRNRAAVVMRDCTMLEGHLLAKLSFDPQKDIWVAEKDQQIVGMLVSCSGPSATQRYQVDPSVGIISLLGVNPWHQREGIGTELLKHCEAHLREQGAKKLYAGPSSLLNPMTFGVYGGSHCPGFLESEGEQLVPFFQKAGYTVARKSLVLQCDLETTERTIDVRFHQFRRRFELDAEVGHEEPVSWLDACALGPIEVQSWSLVDRENNDRVVASVRWWEMEDFGLKWNRPAVGLLGLSVIEEFRGKGLAKFLVAQFLQRLQDLCFSVVETQMDENSGGTLKLLRSVGFEHIDTGLLFEQNGSETATK